MALRIMPMGDSLTEFGCALNSYYSPSYEQIFNPLNETPAFSIYPKGTYFIMAQGGYRGLLAKLLGDPLLGTQTNNWEFVGSQYLCGPHEGYAGETVEWLAQHVAARAVSAHRPDVMLLLAGTNDFFWLPPRGSRSPAEVATRLRGLLGTIFEADAQRNLTLLLGTVTRINATRCAYYSTARWHPGNCPDDMQANIEAYNSQHLPTVVAEQRALGRNVQLVHMPTDFTAEDYWLWGIHFNVSGFEKMARTWQAAIVASEAWKGAAATAATAVVPRRPPVAKGWFGEL